MHGAAEAVGHYPAAPSWDPSLIFVMGGALALCAPGFYFVRKTLEHPVSCPTYNVPTNTNVDKKLIVGGALFGAGWGLGGICPGPAVVVGERDARLTAYS